jgi:hypothetical protein
VLVHGAALAVSALVLLSAGQPLFTDDAWWHLSMGEAYAAHGPWLAADPTLHTAQGPPAPAAWLADLGLHGLERAFGFRGLRVAHALVVAAILGLAWSELRRASGSRLLASLGTGLFAALSAYRLFQLRPDLLTILATLLLFRLLLEEASPPSWWRVAGATLLLAGWANLHAGFVLGPVLLAAAVAGLLAAAALCPERREPDLARARRLGAALALGLVATLANPAGARPHRLYFAAGGETPALEIVADEWAPVRLLALPVANLPPTPLAWAAAWALLLATPCAVWLHARAVRHEKVSNPGDGVDPALAALAAASLAGLLSAVRLAWLALVPLLVLGRAARALGRGGSRGGAWAGAAAALLLVPGFLRFGDWPMISQGIHPAWYARPYPAVKHHAHAVWFLRDAALEGNLWNDYPAGNFLGYWLAPRLRVFVNGSLNVPQAVMDAHGAVLARRGAAPGESFLALLDRYRVDAFLGTGVPVLPRPGRPAAYTTGHLEGAAGWKLVFRNLQSAVYLRDDERNLPNLRRVADRYAREGIPFDPERGFQVERALREAPRFAVDHGLVPADFEALELAARSLDPDRRKAARERVAGLLALLGLYERAAALDRDRLREDPGSVSAARGLVWSLLHLRRAAESREAAERLAALAPADDALSRLLVEAARLCAELREEEAAALVARLPLLTRAQARSLLAGLREPEARPRRGGSGTDGAARSRPEAAAG